MTRIRISGMKSFYVLFFMEILTESTISSAITEPVSPKPPRYSEIQHVPSTNPIPCTAQSGSVRNGMISENYRWRAFNIYLDDGYSSEELSNVESVMWTLGQLLPCIPFGIWPSNSTPSGDYVHIIRGSSNGCSSFVGKQGGRQIMNMQSPGCFHPGTITHEFLHALGFHHEHGRPDRDDFIDIEWQNVIPELKHAFQKYSWKDVTSFGVAYNIKSIMHYDNYAFSSNGEKTILPKGESRSETTGSLQLQDSDVEKLRRMYNCSTEKPS